MLELVQQAINATPFPSPLLKVAYPTRYTALPTVSISKMMRYGRSLLLGVEWAVGFLVTGLLEGPR